MTKMVSELDFSKLGDGELVKMLRGGGSLQEEVLARVLERLSFDVIEDEDGEEDE